MSQSDASRLLYRAALPAIAALALGGTLIWRIERPAAAAAGARPPVSVTVATVVRRDVPHDLSAVGNVQALVNVVLRPQIEGVLTQVLVHEGEHVDRGQWLAQIDDRPLAAAVAQARAEQARNAASLKIAELDLKRDENLLLEQAVSRQAVEQQRALTDQIKATLKSNEAAAQAAEIQRSYARILSPVSGRVGMRRVDPGNLVHANDPGGLFSVVQVDPISVVFTLPQQDLPTLQPLLLSPSRAEVLALDRDSGTPLGNGRLAAVDNQVDAATGTIQVRAVFDNPRGLLWPGEFVTVRLRIGIDRDALTVESRAVQHGLEGLFVFRVRHGVAEAVQVTVSHDEDSRSTIASGLEAGDVVVTEGQSQLRSGSMVKVAAAPDTRSAAGAEPRSP